MRLQGVIGGDAGRSVGLRLRRVADVGNAQVDIAALVVVQHGSVFAQGIQIDADGAEGVGVEHGVAVAVALGVGSARQRLIQRRDDPRLVERDGDDLVAAEVANVAELHQQVVARLPLQVQGEVDAVRQLVGGVVHAQGEGRCSVDDGGGVGQVVGYVRCPRVIGRRAAHTAPGRRQVIRVGGARDRRQVGGRSGAADRDIEEIRVRGVGAAERGAVRAALRADKRFSLVDAVGSAGDLAGSIAGREISEQFAAIVVDAGAGADDQLAVQRGRLPGEADARSESPLAAGERGVADAVDPGDLEPALARGEAVRSHVVLVQRRVEVEQVAILLRQSAVPIEAQARGQAEGGRGLELVLDVGAELVGAVVAVGVAL